MSGVELLESHAGVGSARAVASVASWLRNKKYPRGKGLFLPHGVSLVDNFRNNHASTR